MLVPRPQADPSGYWLPRIEVWAPLRADLCFVLGLGAGTAACLLVWLCGAGHDPTMGLLVLALTGAAVGAVSTPWAR